MMDSEVQKHIQAYINKMQAKGIIPTIEQISSQLAKFTHEINNRPRQPVTYPLVS